MCKIVTHYHLDLDATFTVLQQVLAGNGTLKDVRFLPANTTRLPDNLKNAIVVDHQLGIKGKGSALADMPLARNMFGDALVDEVDEQDRTGKAIPRIPIGRIFAATRRALRDRGLKGEELDRAVLDHWMVMAEGLHKQEQERRVAKRQIHRITIRDIGPYRFATPFEAMAPGTSGILAEEHNVQGVIYEAPYGIGVHRFAGHDAPDLARLQPYLGATRPALNPATDVIEISSWFVHERGYLACWGSRKAPRKCKPPKGTPQNQKEILEMMRAVFGND